MAEYIPNLRHLIKTSLIDQAKESLSILSSRPDKEKQEVIELLALASDKTAMDLLSFLMASTSLDAVIRERFFQLATDRAHLNFKFTQLLLEHGNRSQIIHLSPLLKHILSREPSGDLLNQIIRAAGKLKLETMVDDVAEFIFYDDMTLKTEAIKALERIGTALACKKLEQIARTDKCDQNILDAIHILKTSLSRDSIYKTSPDQARKENETDSFKINLELLSSNSLKNRFQAFTFFSDKGSRVAEGLTASLDSLDHDLMINLLRLTARTIPQQSIGNLMTLISQKKIDNQIKFAAYTALEAFPELESAAGIIKGISDPSMYVRMAAVKVLERHCSDYILAEIRNKIESGTKTGETLVQTILDVRASRLIESLMTLDTFSYIASNYLEKDASIPVIDNYIRILEKRNLKSTIKKLTRLRDKKVFIKRDIFIVVNSSRPFLDVYAKLIHNCGYAAQIFTSAQQAFETIISKKPGVIICDLFLNNMTAMDFAREIREIYTWEEVPIIASSLQKSLPRPEFDAELRKAKINGFFDFPPKPSQIKSWANQT
jgi:CheY-like chemotaxis protein/HEAT repeat protein